MLDRYVYGAVSRISQEAPVPVVKLENENCTLGGAGNVACNLRDLGVGVSLITSIGDDDGADELMKLAGAAGAETSGVTRRSDNMTTVKTRVLGGSHKQMLRIDRERYKEPSPEVLSETSVALSRALDAGADAVVLSDYGKGFCSPEMCSAVISAARKRSVPVFVDPKGKDWSKYAGAFLVSPNMKELTDISGAEIANTDSEVVAAALRLLEKYDVEHILVTRSDQGATLVGGGTVFHERCRGKEVFDVSGAGDTMISVAAAFATAGFTLAQSVAAANTASQLVIQKFGTATVTAAELLAALETDIGGRVNEVTPAGKLATAAQAAASRLDWQSLGERVVFTNGCFDILHVGHLDSLRAARALGDRLIVGVNSDASVRRLKGENRPVNSAEDRVRMLSELAAVDLAVVFEENTPEKLLSLLRPDILVKGGDYRPEDVAGREFAGEVVILPLTRGYSTSGIIGKLGVKQ